MSFDYNPATMPDPKEDMDGFLAKVKDEFDQIQRAARGVTNYIQFKPLTAEPDRHYEDMLVYADGDNWDPGDGPGLYIYDSSPLTSDPAAWNKVGKLPTLNFRPTLSAATDFYVNTTTGSDSVGDGTSGHPWKTIGKAVTSVYVYDLNGYTATINVADGTYAEQVNISKAFVGFGAVVIKGNTTTPTNVVVGLTSANGYGIICSGAGVNLTVQGIRPTSGSGGVSLYSEYSAKLTVSSCTLGANGGIHAYAVWDGVIVFGASVTVSAAATTAMFLTYLGGTIITAAAITMSGTLAFTQLLQIGYGGKIWLGGNISGGTITGLKYSINTNGILGTNGFTLPGSGVSLGDCVVDGIAYVSGQATSNVLMKNVTAAFSVGYTSPSFANGSKSAGFTPTYANGNFQDFTATASLAVGVPTGNGAMVLDWINSGAVTVSFGAFTKQNGDAITSTSGHKFRAFITTGAQGSLVSINALQ